MPWPPQNRVSPSGPFAPTAGDLDGYVRRIFYNRGPAVVTDIPEGTGTAGPYILDMPIVVAAADDLADMRWVAEADIRYTIAADAVEDPRLFPISLFLALQGPADPNPIAMVVTENTGWPWYPDDDNTQPYNCGVIRHAWDVTSYANWGVGTNHVVLGLAFWTVGAHVATVGIDGASLLVREYRGPTLTVL